MITTWAARKRVPYDVRIEVMREHDFTCAYCGGRSTALNANLDPVGPDGLSWHVDHVRPADPTDLTTLDRANLVLACATCNSLKAALTLAQLPVELARLQAHLDQMLANVARWPVPADA